MNHIETVQALIACCEAWEPAVCVMGNVRAGDAATALRALLAELQAGAAKPTYRERIAKHESALGLMRAMARADLELDEAGAVQPVAPKHLLRFDFYDPGPTCYADYPESAGMRIAAEGKYVRFADLAGAQEHPSAEPICQQCGDAITAHDPGICGCCLSTNPPKQEHLSVAPVVMLTEEELPPLWPSSGATEADWADIVQRAFAAKNGLVLSAAPTKETKE